MAEAFSEIIYGLSGLTEAELWSLDEPPPAGEYVELAIVLEWEYVDRLTEVARISKMDISSIFRRILYNFLEAKKVFPGETGFEISPAHGQFFSPSTKPTN
jgi:hypothetical protein